MLLRSDATVSLKQRYFPGESKRGFLIQARKALEAGEYLPELLGISPCDQEVITSHLSEIFFRAGEQPRILTGPLRFINHNCREYNAEVRREKTYFL